jgi:hypothetical protein
LTGVVSKAVMGTPWSTDQKPSEAFIISASA